MHRSDLFRKYHSFHHQFNETLEPAFKDNPEVGTAGIYEKYTRISFVCYLREKILNCSDDIPEAFLKESGHKKIEY